MIRILLILLLAAAAPLAAQGVVGGRNPADTGEGGVPADHRPPPGMCRIWIDGVPAARQPAPTDCSTAIRRRPPNARVVFGKDVGDGGGGRAPARVPGLLPLVNESGNASDAVREGATRNEGDTPPNLRPLRTRDTSAPAPATRRAPASTPRTGDDRSSSDPKARPEPRRPDVRETKPRTAEPRTEQPRTEQPRAEQPRTRQPREVNPRAEPTQPAARRNDPPAMRSPREPAARRPSSAPARRRPVHGTL